MRLYIGKSNIHGIGCFSNDCVKKGHMIVCNVIVVPKDSSKHRYLFPWDTKHNQVSIVLSKLTYCNSSNNPNLKVAAIDKDKLTITFQCIEDINIGDELTLKYSLPPIPTDN